MTKLGLGIAALLCAGTVHGANVKTLWSFTGGADGGPPSAGVLVNKSGNLFGTTFADGASGVGTVSKLPPGGALNFLATFNTDNGAYP